MRNWRGCAAASIVAGLIAASPLAAQGSPSAVLLELKPRVGDTLYMHMHQTSRLTTVRAANREDPAESITNDMRVFSHLIVEGRSEEGTTLLAVTDSVIFESNDPRVRASNARTAESLRGQRTRLRIAFDGGVTVLGEESGGSSPRGVAEAAALMPATFPPTPVNVDDTWTREMVVPSNVSAVGMTVGGRVRTVFRLDSLSRAGQLAHLAMSGEIRPEDARTVGARLESGTISGSLVVDRARGWLASSEVSITARSVMVPLAGFASSGMQLTMQVTQRVLVSDRRW